MGAAHTVSATAAKRPAPARGRCMPSPGGVSGAVHSRGATDRAPMLWSGPRPRPIAWRAHCGRAGHPPEVSGRPHWVRRPQPPPPKQAPGCPQPTAAPSGRCGQPGAKTPPPVVVVIGCACGLQVPRWVPANHGREASFPVGGVWPCVWPCVGGVVVRGWLGLGYCIRCIRCIRWFCW